MSPPRTLSLALLLGACPAPADPDPLDPAVVDEVAKDEGDADGDSRSGSYTLHTTGTKACDCPEVGLFDLCAADLTAVGDGAVVTLTQSGGYLVFAPAMASATLSLSGSLDRDGNFDLGGLYDISTVLGEGDITTRITGAFTATDSFTATLRTRVDGTLGEDTVDCRTEVELAGERIAPSP